MREHDGRVHDGGACGRHKTQAHLAQGGDLLGVGEVGEALDEGHDVGGEVLAAVDQAVEGSVQLLELPLQLVHLPLLLVEELCVRRRAMREGKRGD